MNWNEWRVFCSERELTQEEVGESWRVYKEIIKGAPVQALVATFPEVYESDDPDAAAEAYLSNDAQTHIDYLMHLQNNLNDALPEEFEGETDEEVDTELIANAEESYHNLHQTLEGIKIRIQYYREHANALENDAVVITDNMVQAIRRAL